MTMAEGKISFETKTQRLPVEPAVQVEGIIGIQGTLVGDATDTFTENRPYYSASPQAALATIEAQREDTAVPVTGTLVERLTQLANTAPEEVIWVKSAAATGSPLEVSNDNLALAYGAFRQPVRGVRYADFIAMTDVTPANAAAVKAAVLGTIQKGGSGIQSHAVVNVPYQAGIDGGDSVRDRMMALAGILKDERIITFFGRGAKNEAEALAATTAGRASDIGINFIASMAVHAREFGRSGNIRGMHVLGVQNVFPELTFNPLSYGIQDTDARVMTAGGSAAYVIPVVDFDGSLQAWGNDFSDGTGLLAEIGPAWIATYIGKRLSADSVSYLTGNQTEQAVAAVLNRGNSLISSLVVLGDLTAGRVEPHPSLNTPVAAAAGKYYVLVTIAVPKHADELAFTVDVSSGVISAAA